MGFSFFSHSPKSEINLVLDIGTESVKGLFLEKKEEKIFVLGSSLEYYDQFSVFFRQFEKEVVQRTISKVVSELKRETKIKSNSVIVGLPPNILVSRVISQPYKRKEKGLIGEKEKEEILKEVLEKGKKKISQIYASEKGILPQDLQFLEIRILETRIDGYPVPDILNYEGKNLDFRLLASFLPKHYLSGEFSPISLIKELGFEISGVIPEAESLISFLVQNPEGIFLDVGGEVTQIFLARDGIFEQISEFNKGGKDFSQVLSERLGLQEPEARTLKHRYSQGDLSEESRARIRQFFEEISQNWFNNLKERLREMSSSSFRNLKNSGMKTCGIFPSEFFIFGGGALLPEIEEMLVQGDWGDISFAFPPKVKFITSKDLINIEDATKSLNNPQNVPPLLLGHTSYYHNVHKGA